MTKQQLLNMAEEFMATTPLTKISRQTAEALDISEFSFFDAPLIGVASAEDAEFEKLKQPGVVGEHFYTPKQWLEEAKSVVSIFLPYSKEVKQKNNACPKTEIAKEYIYAKNEAQPFLDALAEKLTEAIKAEGYNVVVPSKDSRMKMDKLIIDGKRQYTSRWSERHVAYVCGMGTFGINKGLITSKGISGRYVSFVTDMPLEADARPYSNPFEYCTRCGACVVKCPAEAITLEHGKDSAKCSAFVNSTKEVYNPYYGCAKCQCGVPCANGIPKAAQKS